MSRQIPCKTNYWFNSAVLAIITGLVGCASGNPTAETSTTASKLQVVASSTILCDLTEQIAQDTIDLTCLMEREQDPHTYKITPGDRKAIQTAKLTLYSGYGLIPSLEKVVAATDTLAPKIAVYEQAVPNPILADHDHGHHEEHAHEDEHSHKDEHHHEEEETVAATEELEPDPHVWHDVENVVAIVEVIKSQLAAVNPEQASLYSQNSTALKEELDKLDTWVKQQVKTIPEGQKTLVTTHDAFNYYIQAYGLENSEALQGFSTEEKPTASRVRELVGKVKGTKVPTIFAEISTNDQTIGTVAREAGVKVSESKLLAGALGAQGSETGTYIGFITHNTCTIVNGLGGKCSPF